LLAGHCPGGNAGFRSWRACVVSRWFINFAAAVLVLALIFGSALQ
jgi:hypothetical protein